MGQIDDRETLLKRLAEFADNGDHLYMLFANATIETITAAIECREQALRDIAQYGRLGAIWKDDVFEIEPPRPRKRTAASVRRG